MIDGSRASVFLGKAIYNIQGTQGQLGLSLIYYQSWNSGVYVADEDLYFLKRSRRSKVLVHFCVEVSFLGACKNVHMPRVLQHPSPPGFGISDQWI